MKFVIASLPRCGSTAVYRVLGSDPNARIAYEPSYFDVGIEQRKVRERTFEYFKGCDGIKHVWDPNGWPFRNANHISSLNVLESSHDLILSNSEVLLSCEKVVILRRRNMFERTLSDLFGQQTNLWGHDPHKGHDLSEVKKYRAAAKRHAPAAINEDVFGWYMDNVERWESQIIDLVPGSIIKTFFYEDLFDPAMSESRLADAWYNLASWLSLEPAFGAAKVRQIIAPASKLNSIDVLRRISNFEHLRETFGGVHQQRVTRSA